MGTNKKVWYGLKNECETVEAAIAFYIDEDDRPKIRLYKTLKEAVKCRDDALKNGVTNKIFQITYEEID